MGLVCLQRIKSDIMSAAFTLVRNFGVIGGASRLFGFLGANVARLARDSSKRAPGQASVKSNAEIVNTGLSTDERTKQIGDLGEGLIEGAGSFGNSVLEGMKGLVHGPIEGARKDGFEGAFKGMARGIVGAFANPVGGALDALSATAQGIDASLGKDRSRDLLLQRKRLPRVVYGDGIIHPISRHGSTREAVLESLGQSFFVSTLLSSGSRECGGSLESYEEHFVLPNDCVLLFTDHRIIHTFAPGFAQFNGAAEIGTLPAVEIPPGKITWAVSWADTLYIELRWSSTKGQPDQVIIHRKGNLSYSAGGGKGVNEALAYEVQCFSNTPQASQVKFVAAQIIAKYFQDPLRHDQRWSEWHAAQATLRGGGSINTLPITMPCIEFKPSWHTNPARSPVVYFWTPASPPGYKPIGDVATLGDEPPMNPVACYRDDVTLLGISRDEELQTRSYTAFPEEYALIWRFNGTRPVTMWMPVAPKGFVSMGAIVVNGTTPPSLDDYLCLRGDIVERKTCFDSAIWSYDPQAIQAEIAAGEQSQPSRGKQSIMQKQISKSFKSLRITGSKEQQDQSGNTSNYIPQNWKVSVWPVDSKDFTFIVVRGLKKPSDSLAYASKKESKWS